MKIHRKFKSDFIPNKYNVTTFEIAGSAACAGLERSPGAWGISCLCTAVQNSCTVKNFLSFNKIILILIMVRIVSERREYFESIE